MSRLVVLIGLVVALVGPTSGAFSAAGIASVAAGQSMGLAAGGGSHLGRRREKCRISHALADIVLDRSGRVSSE